MRDGLRLVRLGALACGVIMALGAAQAGAYVYWPIGGAAFGSGGTAFGRANLDASGITRSLITGAGNPGAIVIDGSHIYWSNALTSSIGRANLDGTGANPTWLTLAAGYPAGLALDASHIYWTDNSQYIGRANLDGTGVSPHFIKTTPAASGPAAIALDGATIYFGAAGQIASVPAGGGSPKTVGLLPANTIASAMAAANGYLYWASVDIGDPAPAGAISRMQLSGLFPQDPSYIPNLWFPSGVATDGTSLYWSDDASGHLSIGRALIGTLGATNINDSFISEPGGPTGVAVDANIDPTTTALTCTHAIVATGSPTTCTATVTDTASTAVPAGTVNVTGNGAAFFSGNPCTLSPAAGGGASCVVGAVPTTAGVQNLTATYSGDAVHSTSSGALAICAGTTAQCGTVPPPPPSAGCIVPKLKGKTRTQARTLLSAAHCALGKVTKPKPRKHHKLRRLVVGSQRPASGTKLASGSKVALTLVQVPPRRRHH